MDKENLLERLIALLAEHGIRYCVIGGQAVNAYVEPVISSDTDLIIATGQLDHATLLLASKFDVQRFPHNLNISSTGSNIRAQVYIDPRYESFLEKASEHKVLGLTLPIASLEDILRGKIWAVQDVTRRASKRQKDLSDIARLLKTYPDLRDLVSEDILIWLFQVTG